MRILTWFIGFGFWSTYLNVFITLKLSLIRLQTMFSSKGTLALFHGDPEGIRLIFTRVYNYFTDCFTFGSFRFHCSGPTPRVWDLIFSRSIAAVRSFALSLASPSLGSTYARWESWASLLLNHACTGTPSTCGSSLSNSVSHKTFDIHCRHTFGTYITSHIDSFAKLVIVIWNIWFVYYGLISKTKASLLYKTKHDQTGPGPAWSCIKPEL